MTAVAVQQSGAHHQQYNPRQSPHSPNMSAAQQSRPPSYNTSAAAQLQRQEAPMQNGTVPLMNPRPAVSNDPVLPVNGHGRPAPITTSSNESAAQRPTSTRGGSSSSRPNSAPYDLDGAADSSQDESTTQRRLPKRRPKPLLQRSKSDYGPRGDDSQTEDEIPEWGARHGFDLHYESADLVSQLANVSFLSAAGACFVCLAKHGGILLHPTDPLERAFPKFQVA